MTEAFYSLHFRAMPVIIHIMHNEVVGGGILVSLRPSVCPSVRPSRVCPASRVRSVASTVLVGSISYLYMYLIKQLQKVCCVQSFFQNLKFWQFLKICNFDFVLFWLGIWCESQVWVIMGRRGVSQNAGVLVVLVDIGDHVSHPLTVLQSQGWDCVAVYLPQHQES